MDGKERGSGRAFMRGKEEAALGQSRMTFYRDSRQEQGLDAMDSFQLIQFCGKQGEVAPVDPIINYPAFGEYT